MLNSSRLKLTAAIGCCFFLVTFVYFSIEYNPHALWSSRPAGDVVEAAAVKSDALTGATTATPALSTIAPPARRNCSALRFTTYAELEAGGHPTAPRADGIARYLHQSWKSAQLPARFESWSRSWCECFPDWTHVLWTDADNERLVREHYPAMADRYRSFPREIFRVDTARAMYLDRYGGIFTDLGAYSIR